MFIYLYSRIDSVLNYQYLWLLRIWLLPPSNNTYMNSFASWLDSLISAQPLKVFNQTFSTILAMAIGLK